jgi:hypothetical protein
VRERDEWAGAFKHREPVAAGAGDGLFRRAVRGDHRDGCLDTRGIVHELNSATTKIIENCLVMDQFTENGEWLMLRMFLRQGDGVAHAKAHTEMICFDYFHFKTE